MNDFRFHEVFREWFLLSITFPSTILRKMQISTRNHQNSLLFCGSYGHWWVKWSVAAETPPAITTKRNLCLMADLITFVCSSGFLLLPHVLFRSQSQNDYWSKILIPKVEFGQFHSVDWLRSLRKYWCFGFRADDHLCRVCEKAPLLNAPVFALRRFVTLSWPNIFHFCRLP